MDKYLKVIIILALLILAGFISFFYFLNSEKNTQTPQFSVVTLGQTEYGTVLRYGPYGNVSSPNRIAYIVGVHPLEYQAHDALALTIESKSKSLKNCYYIYRINVTQDPTDYNKGRSYGQQLASTYAVPDIENNSIKLAVDVHSNEGHYQQRWFLFVPASSEKAENIALQIKNQINWLTIYSPPDPTSPSYVTIPLIKAGIPSLIYETYTYESYEQTQKHAEEITTVIDKLNLS